MWEQHTGNARLDGKLHQATEKTRKIDAFLSDIYTTQVNVKNKANLNLTSTWLILLS